MSMDYIYTHFLNKILKKYELSSNYKININRKRVILLQNNNIKLLDIYEQMF